MTAPDVDNWGIVGHRHQVRRLQRYAETGNLPASLLLTGSPGVGRLALARAFAKATICAVQPPGRFCGSCPACIQIDRGSHPDVQIWSVERQDQELTPSRSGTLAIDTIRTIASSTSLRPQDAPHRFLIIDDAETLGDAAQQAMLKMLEDVPPFLTIVLLATTSGALLDTVLSRCVEMPLQLVPTSVIVAALSGPEATELAALACGRPGWAIAASQDPGLADAERDALAALESWIGMSRRDRLIEAYRRGDRMIGRGQNSSSRDRQVTLGDLHRLQGIWRDIVLTSAAVADAAFDPLRADRIRSQYQVGLPEARAALTATVACHQDLLRNVRPRLALQTMVNQWPTL